MYKSKNNKYFYIGLLFFLTFFINTVDLFAGETVLSWNAPPDGDLGGYIIYYGTETGVYSQSKKITNPNVTTDIVVNLTAGKTYYFVITAYDTSGNEGGYSNETSVFVQQGTDTTPPVLTDGLPSASLKSGVTSTTLSITTDEPTTCRYSIAPGVSYISMANTFLNTGGSLHSTLVSGLQNGQTYTYYIRCQDLYGNSNNSDFVIIFSIDQSDNTSPAITNIQSIPTWGSVTITWTTDEPATSQVEYRLNSLYTYQINLDNTFKQNHSVTINNLAFNETYYYMVKSKDMSDNLATSGEMNFTTHQALTSFYDDFEDGDDNGWTPLTQSRWNISLDGGSQRYFLNTSNYIQDGDKPGEYSLVNGLILTDFVMAFTVKTAEPLKTNAYADYGAIFGYQDSSNFYYLLLNSNSTANELFRINNDVRTMIGSYSGGLISDTSYHFIEIKRVGDNITIKFDNVQIMSVTDATFGSGKFGLSSFNDSAYFDNVSIIINNSTTPPGGIANAQVAPGDSRLTISWINPSDFDYSGVMIRYRTDSIFPIDNIDGENACNEPGIPGKSDSCVHQGLINGQTYYYSAFTYDVVSNYSSSVNFTGIPLGSSGNNIPPTISITSPTSLSAYSTLNNKLNIFGTASDDVGISKVTWSNDRGGEGVTSGTYDWQVNNIILQKGLNIITVAVTDLGGKIVSAKLNVTYSAGNSPPAPPRNLR